MRKRNHKLLATISLALTGVVTQGTVSAQVLEDGAEAQSKRTGHSCRHFGT